ncbi:MAG: hypothetical protein WBA57_08320 [Elainellaceae cyanobacterium]
MSLRRTLIVSGTVLTAWMGLTLAQRAIAMPDVQGDTILISQAGYTTERAEIIDIDNDNATIWIQTEDGDYQILPIYDPEILSRARPGSEIFLLKSGDALIDVALTEDALMIATYDDEAEAARLRVRAAHEESYAASSQESSTVPETTAQRPSPPVEQPVQSAQPVRGLW